MAPGAAVWHTGTAAELVQGWLARVQAWADFQPTRAGLAAVFSWLDMAAVV